MLIGVKSTDRNKENKYPSHDTMKGKEKTQEDNAPLMSNFGPWMVAHRNRRWPVTMLLAAVGEGQRVKTVKAQLTRPENHGSK